MTPQRTGPTIDDLLIHVLDRADSDPTRTAIIEACGGRYSFFRRCRRISYGRLGEQIRAVQAQLRQRGFQNGDAVLFAVRPGIDSIVLLSGLLLAGARVVGVDPGIDARLFAERMRRVQPRWAVAESIFYAAGAPGPLRSLLRRRGLRFPELQIYGAQLVRVGRRWPGVPKSISAATLMRAPGAYAEQHSPPADRPALVTFTSGTTSAPKAVEHTAQSIGACCAIVAQLMALEPTDVLYSTQSHMALAALIGGATSVVPRLNSDPRQFIDDLTRYRVTHAYAVPFEIAAVVRVLEQRKERLPAHLESIVLGGAAIHRAFLARLRAVCQSGTDIWCAYAMTEMFPVSLIESREKLAYEGVGDLVGTPITGATVEVAADGELMVRGPNLFERYLGHSSVKLHATGDLARIDAQGRIVLLGRKKDMIIRGHYNIYPSLYEAQILAIPGVETCALVGVLDDDQADERVVLAIEPRVGENPERLRRRVADAIRDGTCPIDAYAQPDSIVVCTVPHSGRGLKPDRRRLVELIAELNRHGT